MHPTSNNGHSDLDSITLQVRNPESQRLVSEAIAAYRGGALRSAVISTWIAVAYDLIAKLRELGAQGDAAPKSFVNDLDKAIAKQDLRKLQQTENQLLQNAYSKFQLLAPHEFRALDRLQKDRNLCAHPAFADQDELYRPTPELVRSHIVHAIQYLLMHAPLQGRTAIERFESDILSASFPVAPDDIDAFLRAKYLDRAKDVLVINLIKAILAVPFGDDRQRFSGHNRTLAISLKTISAAKAAIYEAEVPAIVRTKYEQVNDDVLLNICPFLEQDPRIWYWLSDPVRLRVQRLFETAEVEALKLHSAFDAFGVEPLGVILLDRFRTFDSTTQESIIAQHPRAEFVEPGIQIYAKANSYRSAEHLGRWIILPLAPYFRTEHVEKVLEAVSGNGQIWYAAGTPDVLEQLFDLTEKLRPQSEEYWIAFVENQVKRIGDDRSAHYAYPGLQSRLAN